MNLFPYALIRAAGGPLSRFQLLKVKKSVQISQQLHSQRKSIQKLQSQLSDDLYQIIGEADQASRRELIQLRRDIFNGRKVSQGKSAEPELPLPTQKRIQEYTNVWETIDQLQKQGEHTYIQEITHARKNMRELIQDSTLQKGLLLSSQSLLRFGIPHYLDSDPSRLKNRELKTELSLIKYLSRIYTKTSPFSTFTNLAIGRICPLSSQKSADSIFEEENFNKKAEIVSHIRLNNHLFKYLQELMVKNREIYRWLRIRPNPTLLKEGEGHFNFLTNSNNIESFQRMKRSPILDIFHQIASEQKEGVVYAELIRYFVDQAVVDAAEEEICNYLDQLISYGFFEFNFGVSGIDPDWDINLCRHLDPLGLNIPLVKMVTDALRKIRQMAVQYSLASADKRLIILDSAFDIFKSACFQLHQAAGLPAKDWPASTGRANQHQKPRNPQRMEKKESFQHRGSTYFYFRPENLFYEDTALNISPTLQEKTVVDIIQCLHDLLQSLRQFRGNAEEHERMTRYFLDTYGQSAQVDLLHYYENYFRDEKKPGERRGAISEPPGNNHKPASNRRIQKRREYLKQWQSQLEATLYQNNETASHRFYLSQAQIGEINHQIPLESEKNLYCAPSSYGAFLQFFREKDDCGRFKLFAVVNATFPGFGKMLSRFLHLFDPQITDELRRSNIKLSRSSLLIENSDASFFNANLHPPLMPLEIWMPGSQNTLSPDNQIAVTDLVVTYNQEQNRLQLIHNPTQKTAYVFDLGFQGHGGRSPLFQLLEKFSLTEYLSPHFAVNAAVQAASRESIDHEKNKITIIPRVVFENRLILHRQTWHFPKSSLPKRQPGESEWAYFDRVNSWRLIHHLPDEVFVYAINRTQATLLKPEELNQLKRDDYKPQYICFSNPFLIRLWEKLCERTPRFLWVEEMLPTSRQLLSIDQKEIVTEFMIQWYSNT